MKEISCRIRSVIAAWKEITASGTNDFGDPPEHLITIIFLWR